MNRFVTIFLGLCLLSLSVFIPKSYAQTTQWGPIFTVNVTADSDDGLCTEIHCTLREAINAANNYNLFNLSDTPTVSLPAGNYQLTSSLPSFTRTGIAIIGSGMTTTIIEANNSSVFGVGFNNDDIVLSFDGLGIRNANAIFRTQSSVTATFTNISVLDTVQAVYSAGSQAGNSTVTVDNIQIDDVTSSNTSSLFEISGDLTIRNSLFSNITTTGTIINYYADSNNKSLNVINTTFSNNTMNNVGGFYSNRFMDISGFADTQIKFSFVTAVNNTNFGIRGTGGSSTDLIYENSIFYGNTGFFYPSDCFTEASGPSSITLISSYTIMGDITGCTFDPSGEAPLVTDPMLDVLADNGGGTLTHALLAGSPALDVIPEAECNVSGDQRGIARVAPCDVGAYEALADYGDSLVVTNLNDSGFGSLRNALSIATDGDMITIPLVGTINLTSGQLLVDKDVTIIGAGQNDTIISAGYNSRVIDIPAGNDVTLSDLTITEGAALNDNGGGIRSFGDSLTLERVTISWNVVYSERGFNAFGGGVYNESGTLTVDNSDIIWNRVGQPFDGRTDLLAAGGGIYDAGIGSVISNSTFSNNQVNNYKAAGGGGIYLAGLNQTLENLIVSDNSVYSLDVPPDGGGIYIEVDDGTTTLNNLTVTGNSAINDVVSGTDDYFASGGGIHVQGTRPLLGGTAVPEVIISNSLIQNNVVGFETEGDGSGGGIGVDAEAGGLNVTVVDSNIVNNESYTAGGGIGVVGFATVFVQRSTIASNIAGGQTVWTYPDPTQGYGAGLFAWGDPNVILENTTISNNVSNFWGGGVYLDNELTQFYFSTIANNSAGELNGGGGIYATDLQNGPTNLQLISTIVADNINDDVTQVGAITNTLFSSIIADGSLTDANIINQDPLLAPLADNGGITQTHALLPNSPALDAANPTACPTTDQRGAVRDDNCDIGAFEAVIGTFSMTYTDDFSNPVENANIRLMDAGNNELFFCTDATGTITSEIPIGTYTVDLVSSGTACTEPYNLYASTLVSSTLLELTFEQPNVADNIVLEPDENTQPVAPTILTPVAGTKINGSTMDITWQGVGGASQYRVVIREEDEYTFVYEAFVEAYDVCVYDQCSVTVSPVPNTVGRYAVFVQARDFDEGYAYAEPSYFVRGNPPDLPAVPVFITPVDGTTYIVGDTVDITFEDVPDAKRYAIWVYARDLQTWVVTESNLPNGSLGCRTICEFPDPGYQAGTSYVAFLRASNNSGWSAWSAPSNFGFIFCVGTGCDILLRESVPVAPTLTEPTGIISNSEPLVTWTDSGDATSYRLIVQDSNGSVHDQTYDSFAVCSDGGCLVQVPTLPDGDYQATVYGINGAGNGAWSNTVVFTIQSQ